MYTHTCADQIHCWVWVQQEFFQEKMDFLNLVTSSVVLLELKTLGFPSQVLNPQPWVLKIFFVCQWENFMIDNYTPFQKRSRSSSLFFSACKQQATLKKKKKPQLRFQTFASEVNRGNGVGKQRLQEFGLEGHRTKSDISVSPCGLQLLSGETSWWELF